MIKLFDCIFKTSYLPQRLIRNGHEEDIQDMAEEYIRDSLSIILRQLKIQNKMDKVITIKIIPLSERKYDGPRWGFDVDIEDGS